MLPVYGRDVLPGAVRRSGVPACQTSLYTPDVEIPVSTCRLTGVRDSVGKGSTSPVGDGRPLVPLDTAGMVPLSTVVLHVVPLSCYPDTMKKGIAVLPRDPDIPRPEVTSAI